MDTDRGLREVARDFDDLIEKKDQEALLDFFSKECEVQMFGVVLRGIEGARKWLNWLFSNASSVRFEPIMILTDGDALFEEFTAHIVLPDGAGIAIRMAEVLTFEGLKIKSLRIYGDRLELAEKISRRGISKALVKRISAETLRGLA